MKKHIFFLFLTLSFFSCPLQGMWEFDFTGQGGLVKLDTLLPGEQVFLEQQEVKYRDALKEFVARVKDRFEKEIIPQIEDDLRRETHKHCVTFDIDNTAVDEKKIRQAELPPSSPLSHFEAIPEMLELYQWLRSHKIHVIFITARVDAYVHNGERKNTTEITRSNLEDVGYINSQDIISMPIDLFGSDNSRSWWVPAFKAEMRAILAKDGWKILATFDDCPKIFDHICIKQDVHHESFKHLSNGHEHNFHFGIAFKVPRRDDQA